jgi:hypothetical protein
MKKFEDDVLLFIKPILLGKESVLLTRDQVGTLAGWIGLIAVLAEYVSGAEDISVSAAELRYFYKHKKLPDNWCVFVCGLNGQKWTQHYRNFVMVTSRAKTPIEIGRGDLVFEPANSQISSFGMGKLFFHTFSSPKYDFLSDFEVTCRKRGMTQIWPLQRYFWFFPRKFTKVPSELTISDQEADDISESFHKTLSRRVGPDIAFDPGRSF